MSTTLTLTATRNANIAGGSNADSVISVAAQMLAGTFAPFGQGSFYRELAEFDLSAIPPGAVIVSATLTLATVGGVKVGSPTYYARRLTRNTWTAAVTWNKYDGSSAWSAAGGDYTTTNQGSVTYNTGNLAFTTLGAMVLDAVNIGQSVLGVEVIGPESLGVNNYFAASSLAGATPPQLVIVFEAPGLTVADNADGTGAVATISGTDSGDTTIVYAERIRDDLATGSWVFAGSRVGDGTVNLALATGHYFAMAQTLTDSGYATSPVVHLVVTDGADDIQDQILEAAKARIELLSLGVESVTIVKKVMPERDFGAGKEFPIPAVVLWPLNEISPPEAGLNELDDVTYTVACVILQADNQKTGITDANRDHFLWRQKIAKAFRNQRLPGVASVIRVAVQPGDVSSDEAWKDGWFASALLLKFTSRQSRGLT